MLFSRKKRQKPGRKPPSKEIVQLVLEISQKNPDFGYARIAMQILQTIGIEISPWAVGRILRKNNPRPLTGGKGPSWMTFLGHAKNSIWSLDLFRCESIRMKTHWVMMVLDQFTRRIVGFAVHAGNPPALIYARCLVAYKPTKCIQSI